MFDRRFYFSLLFICGFLSSAHAKQLEIVMRPDSVALLGSGFDQDKQSFLGPCVEGQLFYEGMSESSLDFSSSLSQNELSKELGLEVGGRFRYGVVKFSASSKFLNRSKSTSHALVSNYVGTYTFKNRLLQGGKLSSIGQQVLSNPERFHQTCGDYYSAQQTLGAKIFFSIRIDFKTEESKNLFSANFNISGPMFGISTQLNRAQERFGRESQVTISALQIGGKVNQLSKIFHDRENSSQGPYEYVQCSLGDFSKCDKVIARMIDYATDVQNGFPSQIDPEKEIGTPGGPSLLKTYARPYSDLGVYSPYSMPMTYAMKMARRNIDQLFEKLFAQYNTAKNLINYGIVRLSPKQKYVMQETESKLWDYIERVVVAAQACYDTPTECIDAWKSINPEENEGEDKISLYPAEHFKVAPEILSQYCDLANSIHADVKDQHFMQVLIAKAKQIDPKAFIPPIENLRIDECKILEQVIQVQRELDLSNLKIKSLYGLKSLTQLERLNLFGNQLSSIEELKYLDQLTHLSLASNTISDVSALSHLSNLERLDLRNNGRRLDCPLQPASRCIIVDYSANNSFVSLSRHIRIPRLGSQTTMLSNGEVLITGGMGSFRGEVKVDDAQTSEFFETSQGQFSLGPKMQKPRAYHSATLLKSGKVLLVGGFRAGPSIEIYYPAEKKFFLVGADKNIRAHHSATLLNNGQVLIAGGSGKEIDLLNPVTSMASSFIFDEVKGVQAINSLNIPRSGHSATLLKNGEVLILGGYVQGQSLSSAEIFDPNTQKFRSLPKRLNFGRGFHQSILLEDGRVVVVGGLDKEGKAIDSIEIFNPETQEFTLFSEKLNSPRAFFGLGKIWGEKLLILGGTQYYQSLLEESNKSPSDLATGEVLDLDLKLSTPLGQQMSTARSELGLLALPADRYLIMSGRAPEAQMSSEIFEYGMLKYLKGKISLK